MPCKQGAEANTLAHLQLTTCTIHHGHRRALPRGRDAPPPCEELAIAHLPSSVRDHESQGSGVYACGAFVRILITLDAESSAVSLVCPSGFVVRLYIMMHWRTWLRYH